MAGIKEGFSHKAKAFFHWLFNGNVLPEDKCYIEAGGGGGLAKRGTRLIELPLESQLFVRFFRRRVENFTY